MVEADASEGAIGAVLSQKQNGKWRPVAFNVQVTFRYRTQLRDIRQGIARDHAGTRGMAPLPNGRRRGRRNLDGSPKPPVFPTTAEAEPTTGALGNGVGRISLCPSPQTRRSE